MTDANGAPLTFAVADLHGRYDLLEAAIGAIAAYPLPASETRDVVFLGDYVDRGPAGADVIARLMAGPPEGQHWTCLKGNHEAIMAQALQDPDRLEWWFENGGDATVESYGAAHGEICAHLAWIESLPLITVREKHVFVHAGVDRGLPLDAQDETTLLWKRYEDGSGDFDEDSHDGRHIVHGHDPNLDGPVQLPGRTNLDTLAWRTGRLIIGVFDAAKGGGPIDLVELKMNPADAQLV